MCWRLYIISHNVVSKNSNNFLKQGVYIISWNDIFDISTKELLTNKWSKDKLIRKISANLGVKWKKEEIYSIKHVNARSRGKACMPADIMNGQIVWEI